MDQVKIAAGFGISTEKLAQDHSLFTELCKIANVDLAKVSDGQAEYLFSSLVQFEKAASASGKDLFGSDLNVVLDHYNAFLEKKAEDAKKEEDKKDKKDGDKDDTDKKASAYAQRIAAIAADEEYYAGLGKIAAAAYLSELEEYASKEANDLPAFSGGRELNSRSGNDGPSGIELDGGRTMHTDHPQKDTRTLSDKAKGGLTRLRDSAKDRVTKARDSARDSVSKFVKEHPNKATGAKVVGTLGAVAGTSALVNHLMKGRESSEEKKAYDLRAAEYARNLLVQDGRFDANKVASALQAELDKAAMEGDDVSASVKAASARDVNAGLEERAWEFLGNLGFTRLAGTDSPDDDALRYHSDLSPVVG
jgi:hypothetical protein